MNKKEEEIPEDIKEKLDKIPDKTIRNYLKKRGRPTSEAITIFYCVGWFFVALSIGGGLDLNGWQYPLGIGIILMGVIGLSVLDITDDVYRIKKKILK